MGMSLNMAVIKLIVMKNMIKQYLHLCKHYCKDYKNSNYCLDIDLIKLLSMIIFLVMVYQLISILTLLFSSILSLLVCYRVLLWNGENLMELKNRSIYLLDHLRYLLDRADMLGLME